MSFSQLISSYSQNSNVPDFRYWYSVRVIYVYDGDTIYVDTDLGFESHIVKQKIRLAHIDAPEIRGEEREEGLKARDFVRDVLHDKRIIMNSIKDKSGKYGRYLGVIYYESSYGRWINLNEQMVELGYAERY